MAKNNNNSKPQKSKTYALGDQVLITSKKGNDKIKNTPGTICFFGMLDSKNGTWYGVSLNKKMGKNNGSYKERKYFQCKAKHGIFVQSEQIAKSSNQSQNHKQIRINMHKKVILPDYGEGVIKFGGITQFADGIWYGIELLTTSNDGQNRHDNVSNNRGKISGIHYFKPTKSPHSQCIFRREETLIAQLLNDKHIPHFHEPHLLRKSPRKSPITKSSTPDDGKNAPAFGLGKSERIPAMSQSPRTNKSNSVPFNTSSEDKTIPLIDLNNAFNTKKSYSSTDGTDNNGEIKEYTNNGDNSHDNSQLQDDILFNGYDNDNDNSRPPLAIIDRSDESVDILPSVTEHQTPPKVHNIHKQVQQNMKPKNPKLIIMESDTSDIDDNADGGAQVMSAVAETTLDFNQSELTSLDTVRVLDASLKKTTNKGTANHTSNNGSKRGRRSRSKKISNKNKTRSTSVGSAKSKRASAMKNRHKKSSSKKRKNGKEQSEHQKKITIQLNKENMTTTQMSNKKRHSRPDDWDKLSLDYGSDNELDNELFDTSFVDDKLTRIQLKSVKTCPQPDSPRSPMFPKPILTTSQSANSSPINHRNRALTFPAMELNTDNAQKIQSNTPEQQTFKIVLMGASRTGKTSIVRRFVNQKFSSHYHMTVGIGRNNFHCEVPINLMEEIQQDNTLLGSILNQVNEDMPSLGMGHFSNADPFDNEDSKAEWGGADDYNNMFMDDNDYGLNAMDSNERSVSWNMNNTLGVGDNSKPGSQTHSQQASLTDYGRFTIPTIEMHTSDQNQSIRKVSMNLQISLDIIDMGFHPTEEEIYDDVNAIILVIDLTKESSLSDVCDKYEAFLKSSMIGRKSKSRHSNSHHLNLTYNQMHKGQNIQDKSEYIPIIIAANKCDESKKKCVRKRDIKKMIANKLQPILDMHFPEETDDGGSGSSAENSGMDDDDDDGGGGSDGGGNGGVRRRKIRTSKNYTNATLLQPPNLSFIYEEADDKDYDSEFESDAETDDEGGLNALGMNKSVDELRIVSPKFGNKNGKVALKNDPSDPSDPFNTPMPTKKRKKKSSKKNEVKRRDKSDIRFIDIISCSAKSGKNVEKLFGTCIKKTLPLKLQTISHKRTKTTAHVTAPIWLRQVVAEFQMEKGGSGDDYYNDHSDVDDDYEIIDEIM